MASTSSNPTGFCIQAFVATTSTQEAAPAMATGTPVQQWDQGESRFQPNKYSARKIASIKKAKASKAKAGPITPPANSIKVGHNKPSSKERAVPLTAPMANKTTIDLPQRFASSK